MCKDGAPNQHRIVGTDKVIAIDGAKNGILELHYGETVVFDIKPAYDSMGRGFGFYLTKDLLGGPAGQWSTPGFRPLKIAGTPDPMTCGRFVLKVDDCLPRHFYYQSPNFPAMGGQVHIKGGKKH